MGKFLIDIKLDSLELNHDLDNKTAINHELSL